MNGIIKWLKDKRDNILIPNTLTTAVFNSEGKNVDELLDEKVSKEAGKGLFSGLYEDLINTPTLVAGENITIKDNRYNTDDAVSNTIKISSSVDNALVSDTINGNKNITAENSTDGNILYLNNAGYTNQEKPVFDGLVTTTTNGIKTTNPIPCDNGDVIKVVTGVETGQIVVSTFSGESIPFQGVGVPGYFLEFTLDTDTGGGIFIEIYKASDTPTFKEITVNGSAYATPSPDAPIRIGASADKGYFDGELRQGAMGSTGSYNSANANCITNTNPIPCKSGDVINILYGSTDARANVRWFDSDGNVVSTGGNTVMTTSGVEFTAPTNATSFYFNILNGATTDTPITPSTAKHICVTINGQYAVRVKNVNKNIRDCYSLNWTNNGATHTKENGVITIARTAHTASGIYHSAVLRNLNIETGAKLVFSCMAKTDTSGMTIRIQNKNTTSSVNASVEKTLTSEYQKISMPFTYNDIDTFTIYGSAIAGNMYIKDIQLEYGTVATPYEPHQETTALIPVSAPFYDGDYIEVYADGSGREYRKMQVYKLTSADASLFQIAADTYKGSVYSGIFLTNKGFKNTTVGMKCNFLNAVTSVNDFKYGTAYKGSSFNMWLKDGVAFADTTEIGTFFNEHDIVLVGELATPTSTPLTAEQVAEFRKLQTFRGVTHITADGEVVMRYYCDNASGETAEMLSRQITTLDNKYEDEFINIKTNDTYTLRHYGNYNKTASICFVKKPVTDNYLDTDYIFDIYIDYDAFSSEETVDYIVKNHPFTLDMFDTNEINTDENGDFYWRITATDIFPSGFESYADVYQYYISGENKGAVLIKMHLKTSAIRKGLTHGINRVNALSNRYDREESIGLYNDKILYRSVINYGKFQLQNATSNSYEYNMEDVMGKLSLGGVVEDYFIDYTHSYIEQEDGTRYGLNTSDWTTSINNSIITINSNDTNVDMSGMYAYITIHYTLV